LVFRLPPEREPRGRRDSIEPRGKGTSTSRSRSRSRRLAGRATNLAASCGRSRMGAR